MSEYDRVFMFKNYGWIESLSHPEYLFKFAQITSRSSNIGSLSHPKYFMTHLTDRISIRITADQKQDLQRFCSKNNVQQKKFVLRAIDHALKNLQN